ncbi:YbaB/EbfC family nucleoid-associated protein [Saccharopolyspora tripterygii]
MIDTPFGRAATEEEARRRIAEYEHQGEEMIARSQQISEELSAVTETASDPSGVVTVTVGAGGVLQGVEFSDRIRSTSPAELSAALMRAVGQAQGKVAHKATEALAPLIGEGDTMDFLRSQLPTPDPETADSSHNEQDEDDFGDETFLR